MRDDLREINKEEDRLQREILNLHKKNLHKHHEVVKQNGIKTNIQNTEELVRHLTNATPAPGATNKSKPKGKQKPIHPGAESQLEDKIQESIDNIDMLL